MLDLRLRPWHLPLGSGRSWHKPRYGEDDIEAGTPNSWVFADGPDQLTRSRILGIDRVASGDPKYPVFADGFCRVDSATQLCLVVHETVLLGRWII